MEGMKDMDGRKPGPSSILGEPSSCLQSQTHTFVAAEGGNGWFSVSRSVAAEAWTGRRLPGALQPRGDGLWGRHEVHVHWAQVGSVVCGARGGSSDCLGGLAGGRAHMADVVRFDEK